MAEAIRLAQASGVDLVEIAPNATPPVCRLVDFGKFRYEQSKKDKESKKHQHANKVKELQLSATIDPHDFGVKLAHAIGFMCDDMKVKVALRFRGREMAHTEFGFQVVKKFIEEVAPWGHPDADPKLIGKSINVMLSPLPRAKRAKNPRQDELDAEDAAAKLPEHHPSKKHLEPLIKVPTNAAETPAPSTFNNPFNSIDIRPNGNK